MGSAGEGEREREREREREMEMHVMRVAMERMDRMTDWLYSRPMIRKVAKELDPLWVSGFGVLPGIFGGGGGGEDVWVEIWGRRKMAGL